MQPLKEEPTSNRIIDLITKLHSDGTLQSLLEAGLVSPKIIGYAEIYMQYDINIRLKNMKSEQAKFAVMAMFKDCSKSTVERAIKSMTQLMSQNCDANPT